MNALALKKAAAAAALEELIEGSVVGVGTGSTVDCFIDLLGERASRFAGAVSSSERSATRLREAGIEVLDLNELVAAGRRIPVYVDGADEINPALQMIKGGGKALTREKILADCSDRFVCIADQSKQVAVLGRFPLPVEVIPMARERVARRLRELGAEPRWREGVVTDNGGQILDAAGLSITNPLALEHEINQWPGVITVGLFAQRGADLALIAADGEVKRLESVRVPMGSRPNREPHEHTP